MSDLLRAYPWLQSVLNQKPCLPPGNGETDATGFPFPQPTYQVGQEVLIEALPDDADLDSPRWRLHPAFVVGLIWNARCREWEYSLFFPTPPNSWLPSNWFDPCPVIEGALYPVEAGRRLDVGCWVLGGSSTNGPTGIPTAQQLSQQTHTHRPTAA